MSNASDACFAALGTRVAALTQRVHEIKHPDVGTLIERSTTCFEQSGASPLADLIGGEVPAGAKTSPPSAQPLLVGTAQGTQRPRIRRRRECVPCAFTLTRTLLTHPPPADMLKSNRLDKYCVIIIQTLFYIQGVSISEITRRLMEAFPNLCRERHATEESRTAIINTEVKLSKSKRSRILVNTRLPYF
ncbi:hypothetical protein MMC07_004042 [Pseudocyphellaria aurata]|nr:hypothetical protein [Pseudocyphellaria aurata]